MSSQHIQELVPNAEIVSKQQALIVNTAAAIGLQNVLSSNLGPTGTLKLLVGGTISQLKLTKDGYTLLKEMQIQHPVAALIARTATAQDDITGDGTTSTVLFIGELLKQCSTYTTSNHYGSTIHPRIITDGLDIARDATLEFLKTQFAIQHGNDETTNPILQDRELLLSVARTSLSTKLDALIVPKMAAAVTDAIQCIGSTSKLSVDNITNNQRSKIEMNKENTQGTNGETTSSPTDELVANTSAAENMQIDLVYTQPLDLHRVEIISMQRLSALESKFVRGLVLDHGSRHPDMPSSLSNVFIMICNISLEYEQAETAAGFVYSTAAEREALVESERKWLDERCRKIVNFKRSVCNNSNLDDTTSNQKKTFCIINQKGIDPLSLDIFAKEGILCLRRAKRRNMERLSLATGGQIILSLEDLDASMLGFAGHVYEETYGDEKYTFVEDCPSAQSCTLLIQGPNQLTVDQMKDAVKDGLRAVKNAVEDRAVVPGAGAFELAASLHLTNEIVPKTTGKAKLGVAAFAEALLIIPKTLIANSGFDVQDALLQLKDERIATNMAVGFNCTTGEPMLPAIEGIYDNVRVKRQMLHLATVLANQLLLVDEVMRAGKRMGQQPPADDM